MIHDIAVPIARWTIMLSSNPKLIKVPINTGTIIKHLQYQTFQQEVQPEYPKPQKLIFHQTFLNSLQKEYFNLFNASR